VCLSVGHVRELCKTAEPIKMQSGGEEGGLTCVGPRNHALDEVKIPKGRGQFLGLSAPLKSIGSLLRCTLQKGSFICQLCHDVRCGLSSKLFDHLL